ncbi:AraC family transcriptional regulator [Pantoea sp.]|uniref:AraC family transcriptional regulator n=1 Tax=Pantoea sp. TaxID=69393 RepID=UPI0031DC91BA
MSLVSTDWFCRDGIEYSRVSASASRFPRHWHDEYVICANLSGREAIWLEGRELEAVAGQVTVYNPGSIQSSCFSTAPVHFISVHLPQTLLGNAVTQLGLQSRAQPPRLREGVIADPSLFRALCGVDAAARARNEAVLEQQLLWLCGELLDDTHHAHSDDAQRIGAVQHYLCAHLSEKPTLETLAQVAGLSKYHLVRRFTQLTGMPPLQYHMQLRLQRARTLLRQRVHPLDAALQLGFYDQSHFINAFRKVMGISPHHYVQQLGLGLTQDKFPIA